VDDVTTAPVPAPVIDSASAKFIARSGVIYWSFAIWTVALGVVLMCAPQTWFGPSWHYFHHMPHNGFWMGVVCTVLGTLQMIVLAHESLDYFKLGILFFLAGVVFWTAGLTLGAEGLAGHQGLMEAPFMCYVGAHKITHSAVLLNHRRRKRQLDKWIEKQQ
jgi:hypothetical protein